MPASEITVSPAASFCLTLLGRIVPMAASSRLIAQRSYRARRPPPAPNAGKKAKMFCPLSDGDDQFDKGAIDAFP